MTGIGVSTRKVQESTKVKLEGKKSKKLVKQQQDCFIAACIEYLLGVLGITKQY